MRIVTMSGRAIVTGGNGLIGSNFIKKYSDRFEMLYQLGRTRASNQLNFIYYDLESGASVELPSIDVIFHFAAQTSTHEARVDIFKDLHTNVSGFLRLLESAKQQDNPVFVVLASTATQYGYTNSDKPSGEDIRENPASFYDISKLASEHYLLQYIREGWINGCSLRLSNVFGCHEKGQNVDRGIIDKVFQRALRGDDVSVFGTGNYIRDYVHVDDVVSAFFAAWENRQAVNGQFFNIGSGQGVHLKDAFNIVVELAAEITGRSVGVSHVEWPEKVEEIDLRSFVSDSKKFIRATGWHPRFSLEQGIRHSYQREFE